MTLIVTINGPQTIWLLADRRLIRNIVTNTGVFLIDGAMHDTCWNSFGEATDAGARSRYGVSVNVFEGAQRGLQHHKRRLISSSTMASRRSLVHALRRHTDAAIFGWQIKIHLAANCQAAQAEA